MDANRYQELAKRTLVEHPNLVSDADMMKIWNAIGLAGEAGEVANLVKKAIFHQHGIDYPKLLDELGDVLWYLSCLALECGFDLGYVMDRNIDKLAQRYPNGFSTQDSIQREEP